MICVTCKYKIFQDCQFDVEDVRYRNESKVHGCCCHDHSPRRVDTASSLALNTAQCVTVVQPTRHSQPLRAWLVVSCRLPWLISVFSLRNRATRKLRWKAVSELLSTSIHITEQPSMTSCEPACALSPGHGATRMYWSGPPF
jgi:hypothetical protein